MTNEEIDKKIADWQIQKDIDNSHRYDTERYFDPDKQIEKDKKKKTKPIFVSKYIFNNDLLEQVYNPKRKTTYFLRWNKKQNDTLIMDSINEYGKWYLPINDDLLEKKAVLLPSDAIDYKNEEELELEIDCFIKTWLDISEEHRQKATWYIMLSWVIDKLNTIPYLRALGDYGTGKTRYLDVIGGLCYKPMFVGGSVRAAPIYRVIDLWRGTAIFDEFTLTKSDETEDIIQILNNGYQRGKPVLRCDGGNYDKVRAFDPFGAKILATRREFFDKALESRCITETMQLTDRKDIPVDFTSHFYEKRQELQNKLLMYRFQNWEQITVDETVNIDFGNVLPRIKQSFTPFTVLFQYDPKKLKQFIQYTQEYNKKIVDDNSLSYDGQIFNHYIKLLEEHEQTQETLDDYHYPVITASNIRDSLVNEGWDEKKITPAKIGRRLKTLGFESESQFITGKTKRVLKVDENILKKLKRRYITAITDITVHTEQVENDDNGVVT